MYLVAVRWCCALVLAIVASATPARAERRLNTLHGDGPTYRPHHVERHTWQRWAAGVTLAIVPGVVVHGIGSWTVREKRAAKKLLIGEGAGLVLAAGAGLLVGGSGGSPYTVPAIPLVVAGTGLFLQSWFTDIYVAAGGKSIVEWQRAPAPWQVELGTSWLHDAYRERALLRGGGRVELGRIDLGAYALADAVGDSQIGQADVRVRLLGPAATGESIKNGSRLSLRAGTRYHRDDPDHVTQWTTEVAIDGRLDLERIDETFRSSFVEFGTGVGLVHVGYGNGAHDWSSELLARFAWGAYLGGHGEAMLFYEHTRDGLVGGLPAWRASGFLGSVGALLDLRVRGPWGARGELEIGNAYLTTLSLVYRGGPR